MTRVCYTKRDKNKLTICFPTEREREAFEQLLSAMQEYGDEIQGIDYSDKPGEAKE